MEFRVGRNVLSTTIALQELVYTPNISPSSNFLERIARTSHLFPFLLYAHRVLLSHVTNRRINLFFIFITHQLSSMRDQICLLNVLLDTRNVFSFFSRINLILLLEMKLFSCWEYFFPLFFIIRVPDIRERIQYRAEKKLRE